MVLLKRNNEEDVGEELTRLESDRVSLSSESIGQGVGESVKWAMPQSLERQGIKRENAPFAIFHKKLSPSLP